MVPFISLPSNSCIYNGLASIPCLDSNFTIKVTTDPKLSEIVDVIFNDPATIVFWDDGTKTVVKAHDEDFDPEKGLAMAMCKRVLGNKGNYNNVFKKWLPEKTETNTIEYIADNQIKYTILADEATYAATWADAGQLK